MEARVSTYAGPSERREELLHALGRIAREVQQLDGFRGAYVLVGRPCTQLVTMTVWESAEAVQASAAEAKKIRAQVAEESGQTIESVETCEVWLHLGPIR
ncbi:antibiotic biosynthesis monooxygenase [Saccharopolyspora sp. K220]|uniref:antibiotic biosynthesis monooxygenase n=1 Tax=Saccharopolyspora soli TaxID=2926618 RepID=UPI001F584440|nr:antibiotic biosynthesis monooxygenase [Saccharopolyspora soli]MCI2418612.1 antibiotic biosynthesis monooxygenase [Saccharopolyspora soli]